VSLAPLNLISAHPWQRVTFTAYALSLSSFEAAITDAFIRGGGREALTLSGVASSPSYGQPFWENSPTCDRSPARPPAFRRRQ